MTFMSLPAEAADVVETGGRSDCLRLCRLLAPESEPSPAPPGPPRNQKYQNILSLGLDTIQKHLAKPWRSWLLLPTRIYMTVRIYKTK